MATSGVAGLIYGRTLVDVGTGEKINLSDLIGQAAGLEIGTTATTAMAGNKVPTATQRGGVLLQAAQAASTATDVAGVVSDLNALLTKLRAAGIVTA
ncbi:capsid fiber protein [Erwinia phage Hena1]|uniref:Capsid fiber protein n=1 Tax=Erwinia phage Hena1 TaxID=2678601 RepID=A0A6B9J8A3_9CAUD|nr:head fiber protein [Erwinia phage Hena1]QGZ16294.1 capsid fiber protein [Erwinia phage Hena1]